MAVIGLGAKISYERGSTFVEVPRVRSVQFPKPVVSQIDITALDSAANSMESMGGMIDPGTVTFTFEQDATVYSTLYGMLGDTIGWKVEGPTALSQTFTFDGYLTSVDPGNVVPNELIIVTCEVKISGAVTLA